MSDKSKRAGSSKKGSSWTPVCLTGFVFCQFLFLSLYLTNPIPFSPLQVPSSLHPTIVKVSEKVNVTGMTLRGDGSSTGEGVLYQRLSLDELTTATSSDEQGSVNTTCGEWTFYIPNQLVAPNNSNQSTSAEQRRIPPIIHQTSRTRCVVKEFQDGADRWKAFGWNYYFHDDAAMERLIQNAGRAVFPNLQLVWKNCVTQGAMKADLWRLLVLWEYGGIFSDLDSNPNHFQPDTILPEDDAIFAVDFDGLASFHFMAVSPRHPLLFLTLQQAVFNLLHAPDTGRVNPVKATGPAALRSAIHRHIELGGGDFKTMQKDAAKIVPGTYSGVGGKTVRILDVPEGDNWSNRDYWVVREVSGLVRKERHYAVMNMTHFTREMRRKSGVSCMTKIMQDLGA